MQNLWIEGHPSKSSLVQVPVAIWAISHSVLKNDRLYATTVLTHHMLCMAGGFFLHDAVCCYLRESSFYMVHGLTCCLGYASAAAYGCGHYYGGLFLLWEISTPFVQLRWVLHKMGLTETTLYRLNGLLMVVSFGLVRVVFGTCAFHSLAVRSCLASCSRVCLACFSRLTRC
jgi:hypothetical protein